MDNLVDKLKNKYVKMWWGIHGEFSELGEEINLNEKVLNEKGMNNFINDLFSNLKECPQDNEEKKRWRKKNWDIIHKFAEKLNFDKGDIDGEFSKALPKITHEFIVDLKEFNDKFKLEQAVQALRNVWIMNIIQVIFNMDVEYTPSIFAYSMLYPYTDNYLDSTDISFKEKKEINKRFKECLLGQEVQPMSTYEEELHKLVHFIENQYEREEYKEVYESLISIHSAQEKSLYQQKGIRSPYERDILGISFEKGGTSVLADAYLVAGNLMEEDADFAFGYGTLLQLCDDLQDAQEDFKNGHMTIFSQTVGKWELDNITNALFEFSHEIMESYERFNTEKGITIKNFLKRNINFLIFEAISQNKKFYSRDYIKSIERYFPFRIAYTRKIYKKFKNNYHSYSNINGFTAEEVILWATESDEKE